jgi:putative transposase
VANHEVGIDVGLHTFATCSDGVTIENPRFFREEEHALAKAQRKRQVVLDAHKAKRVEILKRIKQEHPEVGDADMWRQVSQDPEEQAAYRAREKRRKVVARTHERIAWRRDDFSHQHSRKIVNHCDLIAVEDLNIRNMVQNHTLAKSIHDVAWGQFAELVRVKAEKSHNEKH